MQLVSAATAISVLVLLTACQSAQAPATALAPTIDAKTEPGLSVADQREAFFEQSDSQDRSERLTELEAQALQLIEDEPLRLGSLGNAILELYPGSLIGHLVMQRFYEHVETTEAAKRHTDASQRIVDHIAASGDGTRERPYEVVSTLEARAFLRARGYETVGSMYQANDAIPFGLLLAGKPKEGANLNAVFDLTRSYERERGTAAQETDAFNPFALVGFLAKERDSAAQVYIGAYLVSEGQLEQAREWLTAASTAGNVYANVILARILWTEAGEQPAEERGALLEGVMDNYMHAIALGSTEAMYAMASLYLGDHFGAENSDSGIALLQQAAALEHRDAALYLAHLHAAGELVDRDAERAKHYYRQAAGAGDARAIRAYARFLADKDTALAFDPDALTWLTEQARADDGEAMVLLGNLHATGKGVPQNFRRALRWYRAAVKKSDAAAHIVNEVAWTLTVTHEERLRAPRYALQIMDRIMTGNEDAARNPAYLDTWAAAHAANGQFDRAVEIQTQALAAAREQEHQDVITELETHLEKFRAGDIVIDPIP